MDGRTSMGVAAREGPREWPNASAKADSRKHDAAERNDSDGSHAWRDSITEGSDVDSSMFGPMDRKRTSRASWVRPRCDLDPKIVCVYISPRLEMHSLRCLLACVDEGQKLTFPEPVTPSVATTASVPSPPRGANTPSAREAISVQWKTSSCEASSSNTLVKANFSIARRRSVGGFNVMCDGCDFSLSSGTSMFKMRSGVEVAPAGGGRRRRYTSKRLWDDGLGGASMVGGAVANRWMVLVMRRRSNRMLRGRMHD